MKKIFTYIIASVATLIGASSCADYLNIPVDATLTDSDVFGTYTYFQGYVDQLYDKVPDHIFNSICADNTWGGEALSATTWCTGYNAPRGLYSYNLTRGYLASDDTYGFGIWFSGWSGIRVANIGLNNLELLQATDEEKDLIEGQLRFFRAFFHQEMLAAWGPIPYITEVLVDDFQLPRFFEYNDKTGYQAVAECILEDFNLAADLLPEVWSEPTKNLGRCTALAAKGYEARTALYAASPLMVQWSGTSTTDLKSAVVDTDMMARAAVAAGEFIAMVEANSSSYELLPMDEFTNSFYTVDGITAPWSNETIWGVQSNSKGSGLITNMIGRVHLPSNSIFGGNAVNNTPTQNYVDLFEMNDGTLYNSSMDGSTYTDADGVQRSKMWDDRDARFRANIYVDRDYAGYAESTYLTLYTDDDTSSHSYGATRTSDSPICPYFIHKFWPKGANKADGGTEYTNMRAMCPLMRVAEVYLIYAEALNEAYGNPNQTAGGCSMTGLQAVNAVRSRAGQPDTDASGGAHGSFRNMILNERAVELCFEGFYWYDIRRYRLGTGMHAEELQTLDFNKGWTSFSRRTIVNRVFEEKNYWMPFPSDLCKMYVEFPQNPGWE